MAASVSSGRPAGLAAASTLTIRAPLAASEIVTDTSSTAPAAGSGLGRGRVRLDGDDRGAVRDRGRHRAVAGEHRLRCRAVGQLQVDGVGDQAGAELDREPARDLLALGARR